MSLEVRFSRDSTKSNPAPFKVAAIAVASLAGFGSNGAF
jgi:hypothetical protein